LDVIMAHTIRQARPDDALALAALDARVNFSPWSQAQFMTSCSGHIGGRDWALVVEDERVDGFVVMAQLLDEATVYSIAVDPQHQRQGLGQWLLTAALDHAEQAGATRCLLEVRQSNSAARKFYKRNGFYLDGVRKGYYLTEDGREDALLLSKLLEGTANECA
jgi:[ribosomal protein S18]-alanine N-acetyltransferase